MMQVIDPRRYGAFVRLMAQPDPADLPRRGHVLRYEGDPDRRSTRLPAILMGWLQRHYLEVDVEQTPAGAVRGGPWRNHAGFRVLRRTGTDAR